MAKPTDCRGFLGRIFGHKWTFRMGLEWVYESNHCTRCGYIPEAGA